MNTYMKPDDPLESVLDRCFSEFSVALAENENELVREAISRALQTKDWKIEDVADRGGVVYSGNTKTVTLDGKPILFTAGPSVDLSVPTKAVAKIHYKFLISEDGEYLV